MAENVQRVAVAVVEHEGKFLVGTRQPGEVLAGCAEFPGGKCLPDEEGSACAVRECREETGLAVVPVRRLYVGRHAYPHGTLALEFWLCRPEFAGPTTAIEDGYTWLPAQALNSLPFPDANQPVIELLARDFPA